MFDHRKILRNNKIIQMVTHEGAGNMRELKFRAWYKNRIYQVIELHLVTKRVVLEPLAKAHTPTSVCCVDLLQYIGINDETDREIYVGDVLSIPDTKYPSRCEMTHLAPVIYSENSFSVNIQETGNLFPKGEVSMETVLLLLNFSNTGIKVLGNIYEKPELLK